MKVLLFDTETNGLPKNRYAPYSCTDAYPAILQISWAIYNVERTMTLLENQDKRLRLSPDIPWDAGAEEIHGITENDARNRGQDPATVFLDFRDALHSVDMIICHNLAFDKPVIRAAAYASSLRLPETDAVQLRNLWPLKCKELCTMETTRDLVKVPSAPEARHPFKAPRLNELYTHLYGHPYDLVGHSLHSAKADTHCLASCISAMLRKGILTIR
jgi:DNA polymerase III epsilon subunit-like protein